MGDQQHDPGHFHLDRSISLSTLIHLVVLLVAIVLCYADLKGRVDGMQVTTELRMKNVEDRLTDLTTLQKTTDEILRSMQSRMSYIEGKEDDGDIPVRKPKSH
jgi:hypothetical protein